MKQIAVYCGSSSGSKGIYNEQARQLGRTLAERGISIIYGGARVGVMGALAQGALEAGGHITGVIPGFLKIKEVVHEDLPQLIEVDSMHERKALIDKMSDGVIALPGGFGTLDELFEMLTWGQLGLHRKPVGILNINGFFTEILRAIDKMVREGFLKQLNRDMLLISSNIEDLISKMEDYHAPSDLKWIPDEHQ